MSKSSGNVNPAEYSDHGWGLVRLRPRTKDAFISGWQRQRPFPEDFGHGENVGLHHGESGTCSVDLDHLELAREYMAENGIDVDELLNAPDNVQIESGRPDRAKLLYKLPPGFKPSRVSIDYKKVAGVFELRGGRGCYDALPPSIHPVTQRPYKWVGDWTKLPELPESIRELWTAELEKKQRGVSKLDPADSFGRYRNPQQIRNAYAALWAIPPRGKVDFGDGFVSWSDEKWVKLGMAFVDATGGDEAAYCEFRDWCAQDTTEFDEKTLVKRWNSWHKPGGTTASTLFKWADLNAPGWRERSPDDADDDGDPGDGDDDVGTDGGEEATHAGRVDWENVIKESPENWLTDPTDDEIKKSTSWAVHGLIPHNTVGLLVASGDTGKTTLMMMLAICHATGRKFLGRTVMVGAFLVLSADDPQDALDMAFRLAMKTMKLTKEERQLVRQRVRVFSVMNEPGKNTFTLMEGSHPVRNKRFVANIAAAVESFVANGDRLVGLGLDTVRQFSGSQSNDEAGMKLLIQEVYRLVSTFGSYAMVSHHGTKEIFRRGQMDKYAAAGSTALVDNSRFVLNMMRQQPSVIHTKLTNTNIPEDSWATTFYELSPQRGDVIHPRGEPMYLMRDPDDFHFKLVTGSPREQLEPVKESGFKKIIQAIIDHGEPMSGNQLQKKLRTNKNKLNASLNEMVELGYLERDEKGAGSKLSATPLGMELLATTGNPDDFDDAEYSETDD